MEELIRLPATSRPATSRSGKTRLLGKDLVTGAVGKAGEYAGAAEENSSTQVNGQALPMHERAARLSLMYFAQHILSGKFIVGDFHREWEHLLAEYTRICILAPRDHGKSHVWSFVYPLWRAYNHRARDGRGQIYILSATKEQASEKLDLVRQELESNPFLRHLVPARKERKTWNKTNLQLANNYWIRARGFGVRIRGGHPQDIVVDDGIDDATIYSPTTRQRQIDYFFSAISNMVTPGGRVIVVGTPFTVTDLYGALRKTPAYVYREYPALRLVASDGKMIEVALFPERYSVAQLKWKRDQEIGPIRFAREFQVQALSDDLSLFPSRLFVGDPIEQPSLVLGMPLQFWRERGIVSVFHATDFGLSATIGSDYTVGFTIGLDVYGNRWIMDIRRKRGLSYGAQLSLLNEQGRLYQPGLMLLESNQAQRIFGDELIRTTDLPVKLHQTGAEKHALENGVPSLRILFENHKYRVPRGDAYSVELTNRWMHELTATTLNQGKVVSLADHDDLVMANWLCELGISLGVFSFSMGLESMPPGKTVVGVAGLAGQLPPGSQVVHGVPVLGGQTATFVQRPAPSSPAPGQPAPGMAEPAVPAGRSPWEVAQAFGRAGLPPLPPDLPPLITAEPGIKKIG